MCFQVAATAAAATLAAATAAAASLAAAMVAVASAPAANVAMVTTATAAAATVAITHFLDPLLHSLLLTFSVGEGSERPEWVGSTMALILFQDHWKSDIYEIDIINLSRRRTQLFFHSLVDLTVPSRVPGNEEHVAYL